MFLSGHVSPSGRRREPGVVLCGNNKENSCPECKESVFLTQIERTERLMGTRGKTGDGHKIMGSSFALPPMILCPSPVLSENTRRRRFIMNERKVMHPT